jgi:hypothetical protein
VAHSCIVSSLHSIWHVLKMLAHKLFMTNSVMQVLNITAQLNISTWWNYKVFLKSGVILKEYIPKKRKQLWINSTILKDICTTWEYLAKGRNHEIISTTVNHSTVTGLTARTENAGHTLYMDNFFSSPVSPLAERPGNGPRNCLSTS